MDIYNLNDVIPLGFSRVRNNVLISGLTVTVTVKNAQTGASLLSSTSVPELGVTGIYNYDWTHGLTATTQCLVTFTVGSSIYNEFILISEDEAGGRTS